MTEIDYIKSELDRIEDIEEEDNRYLRLSIFIDKAVRKYKKEYLKKQYPELKALKQSIKTTREKLNEKKQSIEKDLGLENLSEEDRSKLLTQKVEADSALSKLDDIEPDINELIEDALKSKKALGLYKTNITLNIIFFLLGLLSWFTGYARKQYCPNYLWVDITCVAVMIVAFLVWKIYYWSYYCKEIAATGQIRIIVYSLKVTNALLLSLIPYCGVCICLEANQYFYIAPILVVMSIKMGASIYDFFSASKFFDSTENIITLVISILIAAVFGIASVENIFVASLVKILLVIISLWLTVLMLKKCMLDKIILDDINAIYNFVVLLLATILVSCFAIYFITWNKEPNAAQTLFSAVMGIYAAVLGGAITLGGVAWGIRNEAKNRNDDARQRDSARREEEKKKAKPIFTFNMVYQDLDTVEGKRICIDDIQKPFEFEVLAQLENSEHSSFKVERVYHDNQWWDILGNNVVLPNKCVYFDFNFTEDVNNLFMEIKDGLGNAYYYEIKVLCLGLIARLRPHLSDKKLYTIRELKEITLEEINERIKKAEV